MNEHTLWVEKYRPTNLDNFIGNEHIKDKVSKFLETGDVPHLLFSGKAGGGKTTLAKIIIRNVQCDHLFINASDENSVDTIRNKVRNFATTIGFNPIKIVVLDEADYISPNGQAALRNLMETYSDTTRFILTCNYINKIIDPLISRTQSWNIVPPSQKEIALHLANILSEEGVEYSPEDVKLLVVSYYPDIRKIIGTSQLFTNESKLEIDLQQLLDSDVKLKILNILMSKKPTLDKIKSIREIVHKNGIREFSEIYRFIFDNLDQFPEKVQIPIIVKLAEAQSDDAFVVDKEITFSSLICNISEVLNNE